MLPYADNICKLFVIRRMFLNFFFFKESRRKQKNEKITQHAEPVQNKG